MGTVTSLLEVREMRRKAEEERHNEEVSSAGLSDGENPERGPELQLPAKARPLPEGIVALIGIQHVWFHVLRNSDGVPVGTRKRFPRSWLANLDRILESLIADGTLKGETTATIRNRGTNRLEIWTGGKLSYILQPS